jgi:hypothetical protein
MRLTVVGEGEAELRGREPRGEGRGAHGERAREVVELDAERKRLRAAGSEARVERLGVECLVLQLLFAQRRGAVTCERDAACPISTG